MTNAPHLCSRARASSTARRSSSTTWRWMASRTPTSAAGRWVGCRDLRAEVWLHARGAGRLRGRLDDARQSGQRGRQLRLEMAPVTLPGKAATPGSSSGTSSRSRRAGQDRVAQARVQEGRHDHRAPMRPRSPTAPRPGADARVDRGEDGRQARRAHRLARRVRAGARWFTTAPAGAMKKALAKAGWTATNVDLWRSTRPSPRSRWRRCTSSRCRTTSSTSTAARARSATRSGRPARASSSRCSGALRKRGLRRGMAALCIGGGEATAMAVELL